VSPTRSKKAKVFKASEQDSKKQEKDSPKENLSTPALEPNVLDQTSGEIKVAIDECKKVDKDGILVDLSIKIPKSEIISPKSMKASPTDPAVSTEEKSSPNSNKGKKTVHLE
jgi:hypothetical protein